MPVRFDYSNLLEPGAGPAGIPTGELTGSLAERFRTAAEIVNGWRADGRLGFMDLPVDPDLPGRVRAAVAPWVDGVDDVLVLGIGGSALGGILLRDALAGPRWNERRPEARGGRPRLHVVDNPDPHSVAALLSDLDPGRTAVNVVSKSGATAETMALYLVVRGWLGTTLDRGTIRGRLLFTTDPVRGALRSIAEAEGIPTLDVPTNVGGRFSILGAPGLVPAVVAGGAVEDLLEGARTKMSVCTTSNLRENPAGLFATLLHAMDVDRERPIHVLMPYADRLRPLSLWFQQLWAESLGKIGPAGPVGPTPLPAVGAVDQHAQVQLFMEGPPDKVVVFVEAPFDTRVRIPWLDSTPEELEYLAEKDLGTLLDAERRATTEALRRAGRPSATLTLSAVDARSLGGVIVLLEIATVLAGALYQVDPLDQPGVEAGKALTYGLMGRTGHDVPDLPVTDGRWRTPAP